MVDWTKEQKLAWQRQRIAQHVARGELEPTENIRRFLAGEPMQYAKPHPQFEELNKNAAKLSKQAIGKVKDKTGPTRGEVEGAAREGKTLVATQPSDCFDELTWKNGVATATFTKGGGAGTYDYEMSLDDFLEWCASESLGEFFNAEIR
jgi:hypothetical protein